MALFKIRCLELVSFCPISVRFLYVIIVFIFKVFASFNVVRLWGNDIAQTCESIFLATFW